MPRKSPPGAARGLLAALFLLAPPLAGPDAAARTPGDDGAAPATLTGTLLAVTGDPAAPPGSAAGLDAPVYEDARTEFVLVDAEGRVTPLGTRFMPPGLAERLRAFARSPVAVTGRFEDGGTLVPSADGPADPARRFRVLTVEPLGDPDTLVSRFLPNRTEIEKPAEIGEAPWVTLLCRFSDSPDVTPRPREWFEGLMGAERPGMEDYWRELSYGSIDLAGSAVAGWYDLPRPRSWYVYDRDDDGAPDLDWTRALKDCVRAADPDVHFPDFYGINLVFNQRLDCCCWGGRWFVSQVDGEDRFYGLTWMGPGCFDQRIVAHEIGHGFGLEHTACNVWSKTGVCSSPDPAYGCVGIHEIAYQKDRYLGVIPRERIVQVPPGEEATIRLERLAEPWMREGTALLGMLLLETGGGMIYTVEARERTGYDSEAPGEGVVIHRIDGFSADAVRVVDSDGGSCGDDGALWTAGETFQDPYQEIVISVLDETPEGYEVWLKNYPCIYEVPTGDLSAPSDGARIEVPVSVKEGCKWTTGSSEPWIAIAGPDNRKGPGDVAVTIPVNPGVHARTGTVTAAGTVRSLTQAGNDDCEGARSLELETSRQRLGTQARTEEATRVAADPRPFCEGATPDRTVWYRFQPPRSGLLVVDPASGGYRTNVSVFAGACDRLVAVPGACRTAFPGDERLPLSFPVVGDRVYSLMAGAVDGDGGRLDLRFEYIPDRSMILFDDFRDRYSFRWKPLKGRWTWGNGRLEGSGKRQARIEGLMWPCSECTADIDFTLPSREQVLTFTGWKWSLLERVRLVIDPSRGRFKLTQRTPGGNAAKGIAAYPIEAGRTYRLRVSFVDEPGPGKQVGLFRVMIGDDVVMEVPTRRRPFGAIGLKVKSLNKGVPAELIVHEARVYD